MVVRPHHQIKAKQMHLATLKSNLVAAEQFEKYLLTQKNDLSPKEYKLSGAVLALTIRLSQDSEIQDLRIQISELDLELSHPQTQETSLVAPIFVKPIRCKTE